MSSIEDYSCVAPETIPSSHTPFHTPVDLNPSTDSTASSSTSSHQTMGESSAVHFAGYSLSSLLLTSKDLNPISTPNLSLPSYDMREIMNGKLPELLYLLSDFLQTKKNQIDTNYGNKIWWYAVHFDRSLPEKDQNDSQMESFLRRINMLYEEVNNNLTKCLLSHLKVGRNFLWVPLNILTVTLFIEIQTRANF